MKKNKHNPAEIAQKKYGQNFLKDKSVLNKIILAMPDNSIPIVEIGPGLGDLTSELVKTRDVTAYEVDERLCSYLKERFEAEIAQGRLKLICGDVLEEWDKRGKLLENSYYLVANLPYYIATNLIIRALREPECKYILTMVQKEVALKFSAESGDREFSSLSVLARSAGEPNILFDVPPSAFVPAPKVVSSILEIRKKRAIDDRDFEEFLKVAFRQPRKTLIKNLSAKIAKDTLEGIFKELGLDNKIRPHQADTSVYHQLYKEIEQEEINGKESKQQRKYTKE